MLRRIIKEAKKQHYSSNMEYYEERGRKNTFSGIGSYLTCESRKIKRSKKCGQCLQ
jgi:hypothetical protein